MRAYLPSVAKFNDASLTNSGDIFALQHDPMVNRDNTVEIARRLLQIEQTPWRNTPASCWVTVTGHFTCYPHKN